MFCPSQWGWRCRAKLAVRGTSTNPLIGLYEEGTHNVIDIPDCKGSNLIICCNYFEIGMFVFELYYKFRVFCCAAHHPNINAAVELLKQGLFLALSLSIYSRSL